jgi:hypothetical protein
MYSEQISTEKMPSEQTNQIAAVVQKLFPALVADVKAG